MKYSLYVTRGPLSWINWRAQQSGALYADEGREALLFTDAQVVGYELSEGLGPYLFRNTLGISSQAMSPQISLRVDLFEGYEPQVDPPPIGTRTGSKYWLGMDIDQELACLLSLVLGIRLSSSSWSRVFDKASGPQGRAFYPDYTYPTVLPVHIRQKMLPGMKGKYVNIEQAAELLPSFAALDGDDAVALVRAARQYADAVWVADSDPDLAWIQLVGAVEVAACRWDRGSGDPVGAFEEIYGDLCSELRASGMGEAVEIVARHFQQLTRARRKFLNFCCDFLPGPPDERPDEVFRLDWSDQEDFRKRLSKIYKHRSKRLHEATPFPAPLLRPEPLSGPFETPRGLGSSAGYSSWSAVDCPLTLHAFAHLVRGTLLRWWSEYLNNSGDGSCV